MKFKSYEDYVEAVKKNTNVTISKELMVLPKDIFDIFDGDISFGFENSGCKCGEKCKECKCK